MRIKEKQYQQIYRSEASSRHDLIHDGLNFLDDGHDGLYTARETISKLKTKYMR